MNHIDDIERVVDLDQLYKMRGSFDNHTFDGFCLTIDDFYENAEDLYQHLINRQYPLWKYNSESNTCLLYTSPSPRDVEESRMPSSA